MRYQLFASALAGLLLAAGMTKASSVSGDACLLMSAQFLPNGVSVKRAETTPAPASLIQQLGKDPGLGWERATVTVAFGDREVPATYFCSRNKFGGLVVIDGTTGRLLVTPSR